MLIVSLAATVCHAQNTPTTQEQLAAAKAAATQGNYDAAIATYSQILQADPKQLTALSHRRDAYRDTGDYTRALDDSVQLLRLLPAGTNLSAMNASPARLPEKPFLLAIEDVFNITGVGPVVTGQVVRGEVRTGQEVEIVGFGEPRKATVTRIEKFRKLFESAGPGDNVGIVLRGVTRDNVKRGQVLAAPGTLAAQTNFEAEVYLLTKAEGGRSTPIFKNYRPQFFFRTTDVTGTVTEVGGELAIPGDRRKFSVELIEPAPIEAGLLFAIREGGRTVGLGIVSKIGK